MLLVVVDETGRLGGDFLEDIVDERVHAAHRLLAGTSPAAHLLEDTVDVKRESLNSPSLDGSLLGAGLQDAEAFLECHWASL